MGISKKEGFSEETLRLADIFKAIGHPARMSIIEYMMKNPSCICNDIVEELPLAQSTISKHLSELKAVGIIMGEVSESKLCYCINPDVLNEIAVFISGVVIAVQECNTDSCC